MSAKRKGRIEVFSTREVGPVGPYTAKIRRIHDPFERPELGNILLNDAYPFGVSGFLVRFESLPAPSWGRWQGGCKRGTRED